MLGWISIDCRRMKSVVLAMVQTDANNRGDATIETLMATIQTLTENQTCQK